MFMKGDLVRVPQSCHLYSVNHDHWHMHVLKSPKIAIVLKHGSEKSTVLVEDKIWQVMTKHLQLYGGSSVH